MQASGNVGDSGVQIEEIVPGIFTATQRVVDGKNGIVFGTRRVLSVDTGNDAGEGGAMADYVRSRGRQPDWVVYTHAHGDHALGGGAFPTADIFAHVLAEGSMRRQVQRWTTRTGQSVAALEAELGWPTVTFSDGGLRLDLGGKHVRLIHTPGHSPDSVCAYVEEDRVLFGGDTVVTGIVPAFTSGDSRQMETSLRTLQQFEVEVLVGGHGPVIRGAGRVREWLAWLVGYLAGVRHHVQEQLRAGRTADEIAAALDYRTFVGDHLSPDAHGMPQRHQTTARAMAAELTAGG